MRANKFTSVIGLLAVLTSCQKEIRLEYLSDFSLPTGTMVEQTEFGGISGVVQVPRDGESNKATSWAALSDDRGDRSPSRWYSLDFKFDGNRIQMTPSAPVILKDFENRPFAKQAIDPEAFAILSGDRWFIGTEGDMRNTPRISPALMIMSEKGEHFQSVQIPTQFLADDAKVQTKGVRNNGGFESLAISPDESKMILGAELPLVQDGDPPTLTHGGAIRLIEIDVKSKGITPKAQYVLDLSPIKPWPTEPDAKADTNGLADLLWLPDGELLALERAGVILKDGSWRTRIKIFVIELAGATDVSMVQSLKAPGSLSVRPVRKRLLLDLDNVLPKLSTGFDSLDNMESMVLGPRLSDDSQTLLLISDNNFNPKQHNQVVAFRIVR
jgi:hypothetical protein